MESTDPTQVFGGLVEHNWERFHRLQKGETFVEVGGFWGRYGVLASRRGCSKIFLVEPAPSNVEKIKQAMKDENAPNITIVQKAVSSSRGTANFVVVANPSGWRLQAHANDFPNDVVKVEVDTMDGILDSLGVDHVDLLASDCENQEVNLIRYANRWLSEKKITFLAIGAYHSAENPEQIMKMLRAYDYKNVCYLDGVVYANAR